MAYKALKAARGARGGRDTARMMAKMGVKMDELPDVTQVIIRTPNKDIVINAPSVTMVTVQGQAMYQIAGGEVSESQPQTVSTSNAPLEADVQLVAQQTGKSVDESRKALTEAGGDLARAILLLKGQQQN
ncbi:MAG: nascent polypeptide-associated complex protein [Candidatus Bathyarchaeia archaeon]|jgi:nascent polypeptide-associated complex subunit alpha